MGLFRSVVVPASDPRLVQPPPTLEVRLTLRDGYRTLASRTVWRLFLAAAVPKRQLFVAPDGFFGRYYAPAATSAPRPAVLLFGGAEGGLSGYLDVAAGLLASHGFPALAIAYFGIQGLPPQLANLRLEYFMGALTW